MTNSSKRRSSSVEHRSTKRRKPNNVSSPIYSTRTITWEEQLSLPPRFHEEKNVWPALKILQERGPGKRREYLLEWEAHPITGEIFEPTWEPVENIGQVLKQEWKKVLISQRTASGIQQPASLSSHPGTEINASRTLSTTRRANNRRIIPDSSAEDEEVVIDNSVLSRTPTLTGSPSSVESIISPIEIAETQQQLPTSVCITVPPAPADKSDWESLRESQFSNYVTSNHSSSPFATRHLGQSSISSKRTDAITSRILDTPSSILTSSVGSSPRPRVASERISRGQGIQRILNYQPVDQSQPPDSEHLIYSTAPLQQGGLAGPFEEPDHYSNPYGVSLVRSRKISGSEADGEVSRADRNRPVLDLLPTNLRSSSTQSASKLATQPWAFKSQISLASSSSPSEKFAPLSERPALSGRCARKSASDPASQESSLRFANSQNRLPSSQHDIRIGMAARGTRQSPRLQTATPHSNATSPRIAVRTGSHRSRSSLNPPEHSSPLAVMAEMADSNQDFVQENVLDSSFIHQSPIEQNSTNMSIVPQTSIAPSAMHLDTSESALAGSMSQESAGYDTGLHTLPTPVRESIEEEQNSSAEDNSSVSKASSSQESLLYNERLVPQVDGLVMPQYPILGEDEYAIALPAEGKVQAIYYQTIKVKRKAILKFVRRRGTVNTASTSTNKTIERNEMIELIGRLHDTTTHIDLGLPGTPTQYTIPSQEHATYAEYAGSKFVFLGYLMDLLSRRNESIVIMAKAGATQDLLEEYLYLRNVKVRRHDKASHSQPLAENLSAIPQVELLSTRANEIIDIDSTPRLIIAFDASFEALDPQVKRLKAQTTEILPILHLLVTNSSEHVERCLPPSMPSPIRLRLLVRATYQAHMNLGGSPTIITNPSDEMDRRQMDLADISRAVRKSPNRRLQMVAAAVANALLSEDFASNWTLSPMPELTLDELEESPSTGSTVSITPGRNRVRSQTPMSRMAGHGRNRSRTPVSRAGTPSARKRQLEIDTEGFAAKRQRMTPVHEIPDVRENDTILAREQELYRLIDTLRVELANEKRAKGVAEAAQLAAERKAADLQSSLAMLQRRYEKRTAKSHKQQRAHQSLLSAVENSKLRVDKTVADNTNLRHQLLEQKKELETARNDLQSAGGDVSVLALAREEARMAVVKASNLAKSLESTKRDFEFLREQYQNASNKAAELGTQVTSLEAQISILSNQASDEKRRLKELNYAENVKQHLARISQLEAEKRNVQVLYKKLEEESKLLKRNRGVQTRGSSTAPGSPGQRSRQGSPAASNLPPPTGSRASVLRHER